MSRFPALQIIGVGFAATVLTACNGSRSTEPKPVGGINWSLAATSAQLNDIWCSADGMVYAVGEDVLKFENESWTVLETGAHDPLYGIWGQGNHLFCVGGRGTLLHYDGEKWEQTSAGTSRGFLEVYGLSPSEVYAVGGYSTGEVVRYDGESWVSVLTGVDSQLRGIWASSSSDIFVVGDRGKIVHWDGTSWSAMDSGTTLRLNGVWGTSAINVFAVGDFGLILHYDGSDWDTLQSSGHESLYGIWGRSASEVFAFGINGTILQFDGSTWERMPNQFSSQWLYDGVGDASGNLYVAGQKGTVLRHDGQAWGAILGGWDPTGAPQSDLRAIWGTSAQNIIAVGQTDIVRFDGTQWEVIGSSDLNDVWGADEGNLFAVGNNGRIQKFDGEEWSGMESGTDRDLARVYGRSANEVYAVGESGLVIRWDGTTWSSLATSASENLEAIWVSPNGVVYVGGNETFLKYEGDNWDDISPTKGYFQAIWGTSDSNVFVADWTGMIAHFDGHKWVTMATESATPVQNLTGCASGRVIGSSQFGDNEVVWYDGERWHDELPLRPKKRGLNDIWIDPDCGIAYGVGSFGRIIKGTWNN